MRYRTQVDLDCKGFAMAGEDEVSANGYLWIGDEVGGGCYTHTTTLRSLRALRKLCDALIKAREAKYARDKRRKRAKNGTVGGKP